MRLPFLEQASNMFTPPRALAALLLVVSLAAKSNAQIDLVIPRLGLIEGAFPEGSLVALADTDEGLFVDAVPEEAVFGSGLSVVDDGFLDPLGVSPPNGGLSTTFGSLDNGDYAFAVGLLVPDPTSLSPLAGFRLDSFFQLRLIGSAALAQTGTAGASTSVSNDLVRNQILATGSLADLAVSEGLWTSPADYIEFLPQNALVFPRVLPPSGPGDWGQSILPEPTSGLLAIISAIALTGCRRPVR